MALMQVSFYSEALGVTASMNVILPQQTRSQIGMDSRASETRLHPTLYLLHGLSDDHSIWLRRTSVERYAASRGLAVVMPAVNRSFYTDMKYGAKYWTFVSEELPELCRSFFPLSDRREDNFVAGNSMGGYGTLKLALSHPGRFAAAAALSAVTDPAAQAGRFGEDYDLIFGGRQEAIVGTKHDLFTLAEQLRESGDEPPKLYQYCGKADFLYDDNVRFRDHLLRLGYELTYEEDDNDHNWACWDEQIRRVIEWLPLQNR